MTPVFFVSSVLGALFVDVSSGSIHVPLQVGTPQVGPSICSCCVSPCNLFIWAVFSCSRLVPETYCVGCLSSCCSGSRLLPRLL